MYIEISRMAVPRIKRIHWRSAMRQQYHQQGLGTYTLTDEKKRDDITR